MGWVFHAARDSDDHHHGVSVIIIMMVMNIQINSILIVEILEILCPSRSYHQVLLLIETSSPIGFVLSLYDENHHHHPLCNPPFSLIFPTSVWVQTFVIWEVITSTIMLTMVVLVMTIIICAISPLLVMGLYSDDREEDVYPLFFTYNLFPILKQTDGHNDQQDPRQLYSFFL